MILFAILLFVIVATCVFMIIGLKGTSLSSSDAADGHDSGLTYLHSASSFDSGSVDHHHGHDGGHGGFDGGHSGGDGGGGH